MPAINVAVSGLGNIGKHVIHAIETAPDMRCVGVIRRKQSIGSQPFDLRGAPEFPDLASMLASGAKPSVVILCCPSRRVPEDAPAYLEAGLHTVDSFDIHSEIPDLVTRLDASAQKGGSVAVTAAGWDPGTDSVLRALFECMAPAGTTFTNFGRGRSMGHSVAARSIKGVADATSITIPTGGGRHSRLVYLLPESGADKDGIRQSIFADPYFKNDPLELRFVESAAELALVADNSHGVQMERIGASGLTSNQRFCFDMRIDNPALTAQVLVSSARAATRLAVGCYTLIDIPPVAFLPGDRLANVARLV